MKKTIKHQLQRFSLYIIAAIVITFGMMLYMNWSKSPDTVIENLYINGYSGTVKEILYLSHSISELKSLGFDKPIIRKSFYNNRWDIYADFYKYNSKDGSVEDVRSIQMILSIDFSGFGFSSPKIKSIYSLHFSE